MSGQEPPEPAYELNGIQESDFQRWKHHPVSKVLFRYLMDFATTLRDRQMAEIEHSDDPMEPKKQGEYAGRIRTLRELATIEFSHLVEFYPVEGEEGDNEA